VLKRREINSQRLQQENNTMIAAALGAQRYANDCAQRLRAKDGGNLTLPATTGL
jgi:hypothetical protein